MYGGKIKFEGEYLNGLRHGIGKEYDYGIKFVGEYIKGKRQGKGKKEKNIIIID